MKIAGLGVDAALNGPGPGPDAAAARDGRGDAELADARDLARLLYAALTGYWPGRQGQAEPRAGMLPPAPETDGTVCTPRQVSAGVPASIDDVTCRALFQRPSRHGPALSTPAMLADALAGLAPAGPLPLTSASAPAPWAAGFVPPGRGYPADGRTNPYPAAAAAAQPAAGAGRRVPSRARPTAARTAVGVVVAAVLVGAGLAIWSVSRGARSPAPPSAGRHSTAPAAAAAVLLKPVSASSFDVLGNDGGNEDSGGAHYVLDGSPGQYWHTDYYLGSPAFGNLKKGTGLILDMGKQVRLSQVVVQFGATCCAHAQIEIGNDASPAASTLGSFTALQSSSRARRSTTFDVTKNATGRYVLIWLTYLPPRDGYAHQYQALIYHVTVHGSVASQSG